MWNAKCGSENGKHNTSVNWISNILLCTYLSQAESEVTIGKRKAALVVENIPQRTTSLETFRDKVALELGVCEMARSGIVMHEIR